MRVLISLALTIGIYTVYQNISLIKFKTVSGSRYINFDQVHSLNIKILIRYFIAVMTIFQMVAMDENRKR